MADTARTTADLLGLLADNTTGDISPQDLRDVIVSQMDHGAIFLSLAAAPVTLSGVGTTPTKVTVANVAVDASAVVTGGIAADAANDNLTIGVAGTYHVGFAASFSLASANKTVTMTPFINGATGLVAADRFVSNNDVGAMSLNGIIPYAAGAEVDVRVNVDSGTSDISFEAFTWWIKRIG